MKASEIIAILAKGIEKHGDKQVLFNTGHGGIWYEPTIRKAGDMYGWRMRTRKDDPFMYFDLDLT